MGLLVNIAGFLVLRGGDRESLNMRGAILHVLGDLLGSAAAIAAALVILATGWTPIDPILSVLVALLILSTAWSLMREAAHVLLEGVPASLDRDGIARDIEKNIAGVREMHHMHVWSLDGSSNMATLHACLDRRRRTPTARSGPSRRGLPQSTASTMQPLSPNSGHARRRPTRCINWHLHQRKSWLAG